MAGDFDLAGAGPGRVSIPIDRGRDIHNAVGEVGGQFSEDKGEWTAHKAEVDPLVDDDRTIGLHGHIHVELVGAVGFFVLGCGRLRANPQEQEQANKSKTEPQFALHSYLQQHYNSLHCQVLSSCAAG